MSDKLIKSNYSDLTTLAENKVYFQQKLVSQAVESTNKFAFISVAQWTLLMVLNIICLMFVLLVSALVV